MHSSDQQRHFVFAWCRAMAMVVTLTYVIGELPRLAAQESGIRVPRITITLVNQCEIPAVDAGKLASIPIQEGQAVGNGEIVAVLENDQETLNLKAAELNLKVAQMKADDELGIQSAEAQLQEVRSGRLVKKVGLAIAEAEAESETAVLVAAADAKLRSMELERARSARDSFKGSISAAQLDRLQTAVEKGKLEIQQAKDEHRVRQLKPQAEQAAIQQTDEQVRRFEALVEQERKTVVVAGVNQEIHRNELAIAKLRLERRFIRAPFAGVIAELKRQPGEWVEPGAPVARMIDLKTLRAEGFLPADQAFENLVGRPVRIYLGTANSGKSIVGNSIVGKVTFVSSEIDPVNMQVRFRAEFDNSEMNARPGMNGSLIIE